MPIYEYTCRSCGQTFDALRGLREDDREVECPRCKEVNVERRMSLTATDATAPKSNCGGGTGRLRFG
jgi:putative FmdB family regulatory protein